MSSTARLLIAVRSDPCCCAILFSLSDTNIRKGTMERVTLTHWYSHSVKCSIVPFPNTVSHVCRECWLVVVVVVVIPLTSSWTGAKFLYQYGLEDNILFAPRNATAYVREIFHFENTFGFSGLPWSVTRSLSMCVCVCVLQQSDYYPRIRIRDQNFQLKGYCHCTA